MHEVCKEWRKSRKEKVTIGLLEDRFAAKGFTYKSKESMTSKGKWSGEYELSTGPTAAAAKSVAAKDFNKFPPARKEVLAMLITLDLVEAG
jgi:hypothetical protein